MLQVGDKLPEFELLNQDGDKVQSKSFLGKKLIVFFYPKASTPGCTTEACNLNDNLADLTKEGYQLIGVSADPVPALFAAISMEISQRGLPEGSRYFHIAADPVPVCHFCVVFYTDNLCNRAGRPASGAEYPVFSLDRHVCHDRERSCVQSAEAAYQIFFRRWHSGSDRTGFFKRAGILYGRNHCLHDIMRQQ